MLPYETLIDYILRRTVGKCQCGDLFTWFYTGDKKGKIGKIWVRTRLDFSSAQIQLYVYGEYGKEVVALEFQYSRNGDPKLRIYGAHSWNRSDTMDTLNFVHIVDEVRKSRLIQEEEARDELHRRTDLRQSSVR